MIVYKITNLKNNKVYIGQTIRTLEERFNRHKNDALNNIIDTHFARALRYYGADSFKAEIIDTAETQEELTQKEQYWIRYYNSIEDGYNETDAMNKSGGNTYQNKTKEELAAISKKIRASKLGANNPNATGVKCKNINTNEEYHFGSQSEMQQFFNESNHQFITRRCNHTIKKLFRDEWLIAYENDDYTNEYTVSTNIRRKGTQIKITILSTNEVKIFKSYREVEREMPELPSRQIIAKIAKGERPQIEGYIIEILK